MYLLYGLNSLEINSNIDNILKDYNKDNVIKYDLSESEIKDVIIDASYNDLFNNEKIIIAKNSIFLTSKNKENTQTLEKYIENENPNTTIIFILNEEKLDERKKIVKLLRNKAKVIECNNTSSSNLTNIITNIIKSNSYKIDTKSINEIINRCKSDTNIIKNELDKLMLYKLEDKTITYKDVCDVIAEPLEDNIFKLTNIIGSKDKKKIFDIYNELIKSRVEPIVITGLLAKEFTLYLNIKILLEERNSPKEIENILKEHPYRISIGIRESRNFTKEELIKYIDELYKIDYSMKTGETFKRLEMFFLDM